MRDRLRWRLATVVDAVAETGSARTLVLDIDRWASHVAGQHLDIRLTAPDGYQASRSYSLSNGPDERPQLTVERVADGEVSPFLVDVIEPGDTFEIRGPIGGYFTWDRAAGGRPLVLIGGGSGIAPLRAIWRAAGGRVPVTVLYSARSAERVIFAAELAAAGSDLDVRLHLTRLDGGGTAAGAVAGRRTAAGAVAGRIDAGAITAAVAEGSDVFICGPTAFVEAMAAHAVAVGVDPKAVRTERFG